MTADTSGLVARTRRLDEHLDLVAFAGSTGVLFSRQGIGLAGRGCAATIPLPRQDPGGGAAAVAAALGAIPLEDEVARPGCGPVAFGALPFDPAVPGSLRLPEVVVGMAGDGTRWITTITPPGDQRLDADPAELIAPEPPAPTVPASDVTVSAALPAERWLDVVSTVQAAIRAGDADKVVLARAVRIEASRPFDRMVIAERLRATFASCYLYAMDDLVGASPELLVAREGDMVRAHPLAGTVARTGDPEVDARQAARLLASDKDRREHRITIDMVHDTLLPWCSYLDEEAEPSIVAVANVAHLGTRVEGRLSAPAASVLELVGALHPTPAVCGTPRHAALALIATHEALERDRFGGPVGWVDHTGQGAFAVAIRGAEVAGARVRLVAGAGIIADSDPTTELAETQAKLRALLEVLIRP